MIFGSKHAFPANPIYPGALNVLFLGLAIAGFPHLLSMPVWVTLFFISCIAAKYLLVKRKQLNFASLLPKLLALPVIALIYIQFGALVGIEASISLLLVMLGLKVIELENYRDAMLCLFLGFFVVITVFLFHQQLLTLPYLILTGVLQLLALIKLNDFSGDQPTRRQLKTVSQLSLCAIPIVAIMFVIFPRLDSPLWSLPGNNSQAKTGMSDSMMPGQISKLIRSTEPVFRATFNGQNPRPEQLYWRGPVLTSFDGKRWSRLESVQTAFKPEIVVNQAPISYQLTIEPQRNNWLFPLDMPVAPNKSMIINRTAETVSTSVIQKTSLFSFNSALRYQLNPNARPRELASALELPEKVAPKTRRLAQQLMQKAGDNPEIFVELVMQRFNQEPYAYTLEPKSLSSDYIDSFMMDTREGFCEHFSSAFVVMMRAAGVPARVVTGYQGGQINTQADYVLVRQSDAHAWSEVWLEGRGWVRKDPTGMVAPERVNLGMNSAFQNDSRLPRSLRIKFLNNLTMKWDTLNYLWSKWVVSYNSSIRTELFARFKHLLQTAGKNLVVSLTALAGIVLLMLLAKQLWLGIKNKQAYEVKLYQAFLAYNQKKFGITRRESETELRYAERLKRQIPEQAEPIMQITKLYNRIRYSDKNRTTQADIETLKALTSGYQN